MLQKGVYNDVVVMSAEQKEFGEKKTEGLELVFRLAERDGGEEITGVLWLTDKARPRTIEALMQAGWQGEPSYETVGSKPCQIVLDEEQIGNTNRFELRVKWVNANNALGGGGIGVSADKKKIMDAKMKADFLAAGGKVSTPAKNPARQVPRHQPEHREVKAPSQSADPADDLPF